VKFLSHPRVETRLSHTAKNRNCAVSLVRKRYLNDINDFEIGDTILKMVVNTFAIANKTWLHNYIS